MYRFSANIFSFFCNSKFFFWAHSKCWLFRTWSRPGLCMVNSPLLVFPMASHSFYPKLGNSIPRVSWLLFANKDHSLLKRAILSCLHQTMTDFEIILLANGPLGFRKDIAHFNCKPGGLRTWLMRPYSEAVKAESRRWMSPPHRQSVARISEELGIQVVTLDFNFLLELKLKLWSIFC